jgi:tRNA-(ms[2]io[6]A)-hydroxylase
MLSAKATDLQILLDFLSVRTPESWLSQAINNLPLLLLDHAHCERKASATAINFISKYPECSELVKVMSPLAREELLHFEKVLDLMKLRGFHFGPLQPCSYAQRLHSKVVKNNGRERLRDQLLIGAIIEARSCERFYSLAPLLKDEALSRFYSSLVRAEARHFQDYLNLANLYGKEVESRLSYFLELENAAILGEDTVFRFHSGC